MTTSVDIMKAYKADVKRFKPKRRLTFKEQATHRARGNVQKLLKAMAPFILQRVSKYSALTNLADYDYPDLVQEANIAAMGAIQRWEPSRGAALTTMIKYAIRGRMNRISQQFSNLAYLSIDDMTDLHGVDSITVQELLLDDSGEPSRICEYLELVSYLDKHTDSLPERQREAVRRFCGLGYSSPQGVNKIARKMNISVQAVQKLLSKGLKFPELS
jgi:RNA polymerase sigma factor (sigma-70 family)